MENNKIVFLDEIKNKIFTIRGVQVMLDKDLADTYQVETKRLNEQVKRNIERFPKEFMFQLCENEFEELVANCDRLKLLRHSTSLPYVFTEQGVSMLSAVLKSKTAINISIQIINAFVSMRRFLTQNLELVNEITQIKNKHLEYDNNFQKIFKELEIKELKQDKGIFFEGQLFDSYNFISDLIRKAEKEIILIDNYIDDRTLNLFTKRKIEVKVIIYTKEITNNLKQDLKKFNSQYEPVQIKEFQKSHDRFLIIDKKECYHIGASLKDVGKKWFGFNKFENCSEILNKLK